MVGSRDPALAEKPISANRVRADVTAVLLVACAGDDDVSPLPVDAVADSANASKDATPDSAGLPSDGALDGATADASVRATDAPAETAGGHADASSDADADAPTAFADAEDGSTE